MFVTQIKFEDGDDQTHYDRVHGEDKDYFGDCFGTVTDSW